MIAAPLDKDPLIRIRRLCFRRESRSIFDGVDMDIPRGGVTAIMGPSGSGKTTLLRLMTAQLRPHGGRIDVDGQDVHSLATPDLYALRRRMGMLFQSGALLTDLNVYDNVAFPLREHTQLPEALIRQLVLLRLESVGLRAAQGLMPAELSGGMARRVALARALALEPDILFYDEPFTGQDPISMGVLVQLIRAFTDTLGLTSIVVSHDVAEALSIADHVYLIADGGVVGRGTPAELWASPSPWIRQFLDARPDGPVPFHQPGPSLDQELLATDRSR